MIVIENDISFRGNHGLSDYELMTAFRGSNILNIYPFKGGIRIRATPMENTKRAESDLPDLKFREEDHAYLRTIDSQLQNELVGNIDGAAQIHMIILENRANGSTTTKANGGLTGGNFEMVDLITDV